MNFFVKGAIIGFSIAAPVGPIGILCIRRSIAHGPIVGLLSGLGAATADAAYGCVAGFGLTLISDFLVAQQSWLRLIGGTFLCYLGVQTFLAKPAEQAATANSRGLFGAYTSTVFLTLTNPMTILAFAAVFAGLGLGEARGNYVAAGQLVAGVFVGSAAWWLLLSSGAGIARTKINSRWMQCINRIFGVIILAFAVHELSKLFRSN